MEKGAIMRSSAASRKTGRLEKNGITEYVNEKGRIIMKRVPGVLGVAGKKATLPENVREDTCYDCENISNKLFQPV